jgi:probable F420-dependent oxidoreductase
MATLGPLGIATGLDSRPASLAAAALVEHLGFSTLWLTGGPLPGLDTVTDVLSATSTITVATGILSVDRYAAPDVAALHESHRPSGRLVIGLGGAYGPHPVGRINAYLDELESVPVEDRMLAALGPRMLALARDRTAGALPVLITTEYAARARTILGPDALLAVEQLVILETDPARARAIAREPLSFLGRLPGYAANFRRMGFTEEETANLDDRLVDGLFAWGDTAAIANRVSDLQAAGADHIALAVLTGVTGPQPVAEWRQLAETFLP